ncbi:phage holin family protein [Sulfitobacter sp. PS-8MA]|uniref:phage holin family protein n=1 Tax=Sulfitobacter sp. PS-8MA TaxID=3237707 RepID=UPI0034C6A615
MLAGIMQHLRGSVRRAARTAMLSVGAAIMLLIGLLFLTLAAWLFLITIASAMTAALILGALYLGIGFIMLAMAGAEDRAAPSKPSAKAPSAQEHDGGKNLAMAFLAGLSAGQKARR